MDHAKLRSLKPHIAPSECIVMYRNPADQNRAFCVLCRTLEALGVRNAQLQTIPHTKSYSDPMGQRAYFSATWGKQQ